MKEFLLPDNRLYTFSSEQKSQIIAKIKGELGKYPQILFAFLHGSFLSEHPCHDLDIGVYFNEKFSEEAITDLALDLVVTLTCKLHLPVDVRPLNHANIGFCYHVTRGILLVSRDKEETYNFIEKTWQDYLDFQPLAKQVLKDLLNP